MTAKNRGVQLAKRELAAHMIDFGMRASIIAEIFSIPLAQARTLYEEIAGHTSPSGQKPRSDTYYFAPVMRTHAAVFLAEYHRVVRAGVGMHAGIVQAYEHYRKICQTLNGQPTTILPIDRAWRLVQLASQKDGAVRVARCTNRGCRTLTIIQPYETAVKFKCPECVGSLEVSKRLRGRSGRRKKGESSRPLRKHEERPSA